MKYFLQADIIEIIKGIKHIAPSLSGKTILISGGNGFLGRYFIEIFDYLNVHILKEPVNVIVVDNFITSGSFGEKINKRKFFTFYKHDIVKKFNPHMNIDYIIHAAGIASPHYYRANPMETLEVATIGTKNLLNLAKKLKSRFIFFSSSEIYGDPDPRCVPINENYRGNVAVAGPRACYDESKRLGETLCYIYNTEFGVSTNTIRPFNIFGPGMQETDYRAIPNFASKIKSGYPIDIYGSGQQTRTFCYTTDAMIGFMLVLVKGIAGEAYNIGNPTPEITMIELINEIKKILRKDIKYNLVEYPDSYPADEPLRRCPDIKKAALQLHFTPRVDLREGLDRFLTWADKTYNG